MNQQPSLAKLQSFGAERAGVRPLEEALAILSDGAFKLFVYLCIHASRATGTLETTESQLARCLRKAKGSVRSYLRELRAVGVCRFQMTRNPHARGVIEITEEFWPYGQGSAQAAEEEEPRFVSQVKNLFLARACVPASCSVAVERLARAWFEQGIPLEEIEHAILIGCVRRYVAWRAGRISSPIASLKYFESTLEEVASQKVSPSYWDYLHSRLEPLERAWLEHRHNHTSG